MPYSIITKDGIKINNIPDDVKKDSQVLKDRVASIRAQRDQSQEPSGITAADVANQMVPDEYLRRVSRAFESPAEVPPSRPVEGEGLFERFVRKFQEARDLESKMSPGVMGQAISSTIGAALTPLAEAGLSLLAAPVGGLVGQGVGTAGGVIEAGMQGLTPGTEAFNKAVAASAMSGMQAGAQLLSPRPADTAGQRFAAGVQEALSPLPPVASVTMPRRVGAPRPATGMEVSDVPTFGPEVTMPPAPPTPIDAARALAQRDSLEGMARLQTMGSPDVRVVRAAEELGIPADTSIAVTGPIQPVIKKVSNDTIQSINLRRQAATDKLVKLSSDLGVARDLSEVNATVADKMLTTQKDLFDLSRQQYEALKNMVPEKTMVETPNLMAFLNDEFDKRLKNPTDMPRAFEELRRKFKPKIKLNADGTRSVQLKPYSVLDDVRKGLNEQKYNTESPYASLSQGQRDSLLNALLSDQRLAVEKIGDAGALDLFDSARKSVQERKELEGKIQELFGEQSKRDDIAGGFTGRLTSRVKNLSRGDYGEFNKLVKLIPEDLRQDAVSTAVIDNLAAAPENIVPWFEGTMRNSYARRAFMQNVKPELRKKISSAYRIQKAYQGYIDLVPNERIDAVATKSDNAVRAMMSRIIPRAGELGFSGGRRQAGIIQVIISGFFPDERRDIYKAQDFIASDDFKRLMLGLETPGEVAAIKRAAKSKKFNDYADAARLPKDQYQRRLWLFNALQSGALQQQQLEQQQQMPMAQ
jgi:hypothetical protein